MSLVTPILVQTSLLTTHHYPSLHSSLTNLHSQHHIISAQVAQPAIKMGGRAFSDGPKPLFTPRMSPQVYGHVKRRLISTLRLAFSLVHSPVDGPGKVDYGDVDLMLQWNPQYFEKVFERHRLYQYDVMLGSNAADVVGRLLEQKRSRNVGKLCGTWSYAVEWPHDLNPPSNPDNDQDQAYIQVDVKVSEEADQVYWDMFKHGHSDFWSIVNILIKRVDLVANETGLHLIIPEIAKKDKKLGVLLLTADPREVLVFLGLDGLCRHDCGSSKESCKVCNLWNLPFSTPRELFEYISTCRYFAAFIERKRTERQLAEHVDQPAGPADQPAGPVAPKKLSASNKKRLLQRPLFREFVEVFCEEKTVAPPPATLEPAGSAQTCDAVIASSSSASDAPSNEAGDVRATTAREPTTVKSHDDSEKDRQEGPATYDARAYGLMPSGNAPTRDQLANRGSADWRRHPPTADGARAAAMDFFAGARERYERRVDDFATAQAERDVADLAVAAKLEALQLAELQANPPQVPTSAEKERRRRTGAAFKRLFEAEAKAVKMGREPSQGGTVPVPFDENPAVAEGVHKHGADLVKAHHAACRDAEGRLVLDKAVHFVDTWWDALYEAVVAQVRSSRPADEEKKTPVELRDMARDIGALARRAEEGRARREESKAAAEDGDDA